MSYMFGLTDNCLPIGILETFGFCLYQFLRELHNLFSSRNSTVKKENQTIFNTSLVQIKMTAARASRPCCALFCHDCVLGHIKSGSEAVWGLLSMGSTCVAGACFEISMNFTKFPKSLVATRAEKGRGGCRRSCNSSSTPGGKDGEDLRSGTA
ncbi:hypothetical protein AV530_002557 [Patagioenas fasciata monilis]|uniref:Uncharacterized protein n=1 Tax=Patagioenas fasciata monilis TaxID=372326 RepID=A0A1V4K723_PATFA|nr:hypothetical protein AV530_002557 [Patagioenas fasciata monilis]